MNQTKAMTPAKIRLLMVRPPRVEPSPAGMYRVMLRGFERRYERDMHDMTALGLSMMSAALIGMRREARGL